MVRKIRVATGVSAPKILGHVHDCVLCGGRFKVIKSSQIFVDTLSGEELLATRCPYCSKINILDADPHEKFREKLTKFIMSQVEPIKSIKNEDVRLPMQKLLDDFNALVQDE